MRLFKQLALIPLLAAMLAQSQAHSAPANPVNDKPRLSTTKLIGAQFSDEELKYHYSPTQLTQRSIDKSAGRLAKLPNRERTISHARNSLWIYDLSISLLADLDFDGMYSSFRVSLDLDSNGYSQDVYAVMYLSQNGGTWQEYAVTGNFTVTGSSNHDRISIETELESGYYSGNYDHYIEVYDDFGVAVQFSLGNDYDSSVYDSSVDVSLSFSGSGSFELATLIALLLLALYRYHQSAMSHGRKKFQAE